ncbi:MAG: hypothetical protein A2V70_13085 [Planctomycetes bacterium RBG_13_63_9]|nr:MAG: hypothetical protein A2V70_13085 [Planctomycetes bacterium RBG_13_63_9]
MQPCDHAAMRVGVGGLLLLAVLCGCAPLQLDGDFAWPGTQPKPKVPDRMTDVWTYTVLRQSGQPGVRGFGGRMMFYAEDEEEPTTVDGTLTIFAFDATDDDPNHVTPERKFVFPAEELSKHHSKSKMGYSYSFWIPWDEVGGVQRQLSLITRFESSTGKVLMGEASRHLLPGLLPQAVAREANAARPPNAVADGRIQQVAHQAPVENAPAKETMTTMTIDVTPNFARQILGGAAEAPQDTAAQVPTTRAGQPGGPADSKAFQPQLQPAAESLRSTRYAPRRFPARRGSALSPNPDPVRRQPHHVVWPSHLPPTPRSGWNGSNQATTPTVVPGPDPEYQTPAW